MPVPVSTQTACTRCAVLYDSALVGGACPVCRTPAPGVRASAGAAAGDHALVLVAVATIANVLLLAILTAYLLR